MADTIAHPCYSRIPGTDVWKLLGHQYADGTFIEAATLQLFHKRCGSCKAQVHLCRCQMEQPQPQPRPTPPPAAPQPPPAPIAAQATPRRVGEEQRWPLLRARLRVEQRSPEGKLGRTVSLQEFAAMCAAPPAPDTLGEVVRLQKERGLR